MAKAFEIAAEIVAADEYGGSSGDMLTPRDFGELRVKQWGKFARKHGLVYRDHPAPADVAADQRLVAMFTELRNLGYPLTHVSGLMEGSWQGCAFTSFHTYDATEEGRLRPYRFACVRLSRPYPDLVHDKGLSGTSRDKEAWYPALETYQVLDGPTPAKKERKRGLLARTPVGRAVAAAADGLFGPVTPKLRTASAEYGAAFVARASQPYEPHAFRYDWAVRGPWLVFHHYDGERGLVDNGGRAAFLNAFPLVKRLVD